MTTFDRPSEKTNVDIFESLSNFIPLFDGTTYNHQITGIHSVLSAMDLEVDYSIKANPLGDDFFLVIDIYSDSGQIMQAINEISEFPLVSSSKEPLQDFLMQV